MWDLMERRLISMQRKSSNALKCRRSDPAQPPTSRSRTRRPPRWNSTTARWAMRASAVTWIYGAGGAHTLSRLNQGAPGPWQAKHQ